MVTLKIKENSKQAKAVLEMLKTFSFVEVISTTGQKESVVPTKPLTPKQRTLVNRLKKVKRDVDAGTFKGQSAQSFLDEL